MNNIITIGLLCLVGVAAICIAILTNLWLDAEHEAQQWKDIAKRRRENYWYVNTTSRDNMDERDDNHCGDWIIYG